MLVVVLWAMGLVALAVGTVSQRMTHELRMSQLANDHVQRQAIAQAAVQQALAVLKQDDSTVDHLGESWATGVDEQAQPLLGEIAVGHGRFSVTLVDESRKLNLNTSAPETLTRLIEGVQPDPQVDATALAAAIADWRDAPEGSVCAGRNPACHNAPLETVHELLLVPGMTAALFDALAPYVTIYGNGAINLNTADPIVLRAAGLTDQQITTLAQQRQQQPYTSVPLGLPDGLGVSSTHFEAQIIATVSNHSTPSLLRVILDRSGTVYESA